MPIALPRTPIYVLQSSADVAITSTIPPVAGISAEPNDRVEERQEIKRNDPAGEYERCQWPGGDFPITICKRNTEEKGGGRENGE